jgi:hypothetical protein
MIYIQDIILNLNNDFIEFFEWNNNDYLTHIRKIPIFKINKDELYKLIKYNIIQNQNFLDSIKNKCHTFSKIKHEYLFLACTEEKVIAVLTNKYGEIKCLSDLLIEEEDDILEDISKYPFINLSIQTKNQIDTKFITRNNKDKIKFVYNCLNSITTDLYEYLCLELNIDTIDDEIILNNYNKMYNFFNLIHNKK